MEGWQEIFAIYPFLGVTWNFLIIAVPLSALLAYSGIFYLSATCRILGVSRKRSSFDKCAKQLAMFGLIFGWSLLVLSRLWLYFTPHLHPAGSFQNFLMEISWMMLSVGVLLNSIYFLLWKILKNMPVLHVTLGMIGATQNCLALICVLFTIRLSSGMLDPEFRDLVLPEHFPQTWDAPLWNALGYTIPLIFALAAGMGICWLILRRKYDDFGRDYYKSMLQWCSLWARNAWGLLWLLFASSMFYRLWQQFNLQNLNEEAIFIELGLCLIWFLPLVFWQILYKSQMPMRHKIAAFLASILGVAFTYSYFLEITLIFR